MSKICIRLVMLLAVLLTSQTASAAIEPNGVLDEVAVRFMIASATWSTVITNHAVWLFWTLGTISLVWTGGTLILKQADMREFFAEFMRFILTFGFFLWLLRNGPDFATSIIDSLRTIGAQAGGLPRDLTPSEPISIAFDIIVKAGEYYSITNPIDNLSIFFITLAILAYMAVVAANVLLALVTAWILIYAGVFVLGFGGSRWTSDIAINYFKSVLGVALKLMTMTLLIGIAMSIMDGFYAELSNDAPMRELLVIFVVSLVLVMLIHSVPNVVASLVPGGGAAAGAGSISAGAMAGAAVATGGMAAGAAMATAGGASAIQAAFAKAGENVANNADVMSSLSSTFSGSGDSDEAGSFSQASGQSFSNGESSGGFKDSVAKAGRVAADTGANLIKGVGDMAGERISQTAGGRLAASVRNNMKGDEEDDKEGD
ncbi:P-type conjugative transfer protein TrbL [Vibrio parahaemolyticus]|uniref:P-type conjugative transfer protein TrbL n=1 Tax=Vibrio parahaemolyticus TaxID=670 RepID=UPI00111EEAC9|nr:P-type conjugative transfer protein TrbL [Vibrio parahaemolyticus]TOB51168.1 P-type conjugative transfer protein TrbL [Vibrio parahaemolyticus]